MPGRKGGSQVEGQGDEVKFKRLEEALEKANDDLASSNRSLGDANE